MAITIKKGDQLIEACLTNGNKQIILAAREGKAIRFHEKLVRPIGRTGSGVRGMHLAQGDSIIGMICVEENENKDILVVAENGYGKRSKLDDYRVTGRGGKGVKTITITPKTGKLISIKAVDDNNDIMIINKSGLTIRLSAKELRVIGRTAQGVKLINLRKNDSIAAIANVEASDEENIDQQETIDNDESVNE